MRRWCVSGCNHEEIGCLWFSSERLMCFHIWNSAKTLISIWSVDNRGPKTWWKVRKKVNSVWDRSAQNLLCIHSKANPISSELSNSTCFMRSWCPCEICQSCWCQTSLVSSVCWFVMVIVMVIIRQVRRLLSHTTTLRQWQKCKFLSCCKSQSWREWIGSFWCCFSFEKGWCAFYFGVLKKLRSILWKWQSIRSRGPETREKFVRRLTRSRKDLFQRYWILAMRQIPRKNLIST